MTAIARRRGFPGILTRKRSARRLKTHETACATAAVANEARTRCAEACGLDDADASGTARDGGTDDALVSFGSRARRRLETRERCDDAATPSRR